LISIGRQNYGGNADHRDTGIQYVDIKVEFWLQYDDRNAHRADRNQGEPVRSAAWLMLRTLSCLSVLRLRHVRS
jgi:hypothetical protein